MEIIYISNGLGNQMSEYAMYLRKLHVGAKAVYACHDKLHNGVELDKVFDIPVNKGVLNLFYIILAHIMMAPAPNLLVSVARKYLKKIGISIFLENYHYEFNPNVVRKSRSRICLILGGWHHWRYLEGIEDQVQEIYTFKPFSNIKNCKIAEEALMPNSVAIHIRRGDYLTGDNYRKYGSVCNESYYKKSIEFIEEYIKKPVYYIFSNDMEWAKSLLTGKKYVCIDWNTKESSWADMALMSKFHHIIIANSTFSWWAAWLGSKGKLIVCPPVLMNNDAGSDIYPPEWHHIYNY